MYSIKTTLPLPIQGQQTLDKESPAKKGVSTAGELILTTATWANQDKRDRNKNIKPRAYASKKKSEKALHRWIPHSHDLSE